MKFSNLLSLSAVLLLSAPLSQIHADQSWSGGTNTWTLDQTVKNWDNNTNGWQSDTQFANFTSSPGVVTVDNSYGDVGAFGLSFGGTAATWDVTGDALAIQKYGYNALVYNSNTGGTTTIDSDLIVDQTADTDRYNFFDGSGGAGGTLVIGNVSFVDPTPDGNNVNRSMIVGSSNSGSNIYLKGTYTDSSSTGGPSMEIRLGEGGGDQMHYYLTGNFAGMTNGISIGEGNVYVAASAVLGTHGFNIYNDQGVATQNSALYGTQGVTISNNIYLSAKYDDSSKGSRYGNGTVGVSDASAVTFTGGIGLDSTNLNLSAVAGGRATISTNGINNQSPAGLSKTGAGTVVLATANTYGTLADGRDNADAGTVAMDVKAGTLLITNTTGSAFGNGNQYNGLPDTTTANVEGGATLGGSGISTQKVVAMAANSVIAPGDAGTDGGVASIGKLHLQGGLTASAGLTMDFKLVAPGNSDSLDLGAGAFTLAGPVTINLTAFSGSVSSGTYTLASGTGTWTSSSTFTFVAPLGDTVTSYSFDQNGNDQFNVTLAAPEPSTYALMLGGFALLAFCVRRKLA